jgi:LacI family transcriptional regulator
MGGFRHSSQVTITQVAREAGVSTQTVSRVINNRPDVSAQTRERVESIISRLGYQPNAIARSLTRRRSHTLGVVATGLEYFGSSRTLVGIEQAAVEKGLSLLLCLLHEPATDSGERVLKSLLARQVDGIIWAVPEIGHNRAWLQMVVPQLKVPMVFLSMAPRPGLPVVTMDNRGGGQLAVEHLLAQGYRQIGMLTGPDDWWEARERQAGWQAALRHAGRPAEARQCVAGDWTARSGERGLEQLLAQCPDMDAVFASNDQMALGLLKAARHLGRRVPDDLAVVGFDDIPEAAFFYPPLTSVRQELTELGAQAVHTLARRLEAASGNSETPPEPQRLAARLIVRASSGVTAHHGAAEPA